MEFQLDMNTMFISLVIGHLFTAVLVSAYWRHHKKDTTMSTFFIAKFVQATAWLLLIIHGGITDSLTISLTNSLLYLGTFLEVVGVLKLQNAFNHLTQKMCIALLAVNMIGFHVIMLVHNEEHVRIAFASIGTAAMILIPAYRMIMQRTSSLLMRTMGYFYLFIIVTLCVRALATVFSTHSIGFFFLA